MADYIINGVLTGLHYHKAGQYRSLERVTCIMLALLIVVIIVSAFCLGDGGHRVDQSNHVVANPRFRGGFSYSPPSSPHFAPGYLGQVRIVGHNPVPIAPASMLPAAIVFDFRPGPRAFGSLADVPAGDPAGDPDGTLSLDADFGLPDPLPLWRFTLRDLPAGIVDQRIRLPIDRSSHAMLVSPTWPSDVWLVDDTAVVEGYLTMHSYGRMSFALVSETHPRLGFAAAVQNAVAQSVCFPALDSFGNRLTVRCRYRCLFFFPAQSSVSVDGSITARLRQIPRLK